LDRLIDALKDEDALRRFADTLNGK
jgi:hypothetical protein